MGSGASRGGRAGPKMSTEEHYRNLLLEKTEEIVRLKKRNGDLETGIQKRDEEIRRLRKENEEKTKEIHTLKQSKVRRFSGHFTAVSRVSVDRPGRWLVFRARTKERDLLCPFDA